MRRNLSRRYLGPAVAIGALAVVAGSPQAASGQAPQTSTSPVYSTWDASVALGESILVRTDDGISASLRTSDLPAGQAVTLWFGVFNVPSACASSPCGMADIGNPAVQVDFLWGAGSVTGGGGQGTFGGRLAAGDSSGSLFRELGIPEAAVGLLDPWGAEVHLLLHSHGPASTGQDLKHQLTSFLGGCEVFNGPGGFAAGPGDIPDAAGECSTFQESIHP